MTVRVENGDMLEVIPRLVAEGVVCDSVVTDPPYHLTATLSRFGKQGSAPAQHGRDGAMARLSSGFMGQQWDGGDIAFRPETWATVATILRPGAFLVAFGGTRTYHRLVSAIEDAGFVIQDQLAWLFASGFPKNKSQLKPAHEPIVLAYKVGGKRAMQVDECRIEGGREQEQEQGRYDGSDVQVVGPRTGGKIYPASLGRWPANVVLENCDEVVACFPESQDGVAGIRTGAKNVTNFDFGAYDKPWGGYGGGGSAARFFFSAKAGSDDRWHSRHPTVKPVALMRWLVALVTPPGGLVLDPFAGSGTTGAAALVEHRNAILIEREESYIADIHERLAAAKGMSTLPTPTRKRAKREPGLLSGLDEA